jgi:hypothetical protein
MVTRRAILVGIGGGAALVAAGGVWRVMRRPDRAIGPWYAITEPSAEPVADVRLDAFRHAILAPNPHNRQPWLIRLEGPHGALLTCDLAKRLPETDPFDRQITLGFGTFIELARIAASRRGYRIDVTPFPQGEPQPRLDARPLAHLRFVRDGAIAPDPLLAAIPRRHTSREVFSSALTAAQLAALARDGTQASADPRLLNQIRPISVAAMTREITLPRTWMESVRLLRIGAAEIDATPDGLALSGPMIEATHLAGLTTRATLADPNSTAFRLGLKQQQAVCGSVPAVAWIASTGNSRAAQLSAGMAYARLSLRAAAMGLSMHPLSQSLQEYPEMAGLFSQIHSVLDIKPPQRLQMLLRVGIGPPVLPAARYPLEAHLVR